MVSILLHSAPQSAPFAHTILLLQRGVDCLFQHLLHSLYYLGLGLKSIRLLSLTITADRLRFQFSYHSFLS